MEYDKFKGAEVKVYELEDHNTGTVMLTYDLVNPLDGVFRVIEHLKKDSQRFSFYDENRKVIAEDIPKKRIDLLKIFDVLEITENHIEEMD